MTKILIVEDNEDMQHILSNLLHEEGYETIAVLDGESALKEVKKNDPNLVLLDIKLPGMDGMKVLNEMQKIDKDLQIIMLTAYGDIKDAVNAMKLGAYDYITKPFNNDELLLIISKALQTHYLTREVKHLRKKLGEKTAEDIVLELGGESTKVKQVLEYINIVCPTNVSVILRGESGTGKELIAQLIHMKSQRRERAFVAIDCGAIPETLVESELFGYEKGAFTGADRQKEGRFELAQEGTLFLDEITNLPEVAQTKLLRVLQEKKVQRLGGKKDIKVDVRIIVATNIPLFNAVKKGKFREDLFYRLNEFEIIIPTLRERKEDIPILAKRFLDEANNEFGKNIKGFTPQAMESLLTYRWPGNVREFKNAIRKTVLLTNSKNIDRIYFPNDDLNTPEKPEFNEVSGEGSSLHDLVRDTTNEMERDIIIKTLSKVGGNKSKAARLLKINRITLYAKLKRFDIK